ncbi:MAG: AAA family ATPase [bacterium]|nr:AAA family ATPase [bacterium]
MIDSFYIKNFRLFKELKIERFGQVNLVVGKNNSGKSCLLEALHVYAKKANPDLLYDLVESRGEDWEVERLSKDEYTFHDIEHPFRHLFHNYHFPESGKNSIEIGSLHNKAERLKLHIGIYGYTDKNKYSALNKIVDEAIDVNTLNTELVLELEDNNKTNPLAILKLDDNSYQKSSRIFKRSEGNGKTHIQFVPTKYMDYRKVGDLWDNINLYPDLRQEVFKALQLVDERIQEVVVLGRGWKINPILILHDSDERIPLTSYGDGMLHLFHIILALVNSRGGILLIDEFENGIHYSILEKVWNLVFKLAEQLEVQLFATTHSLDCINAFHSAAQEQAIEGILLNLSSRMKDNEKITLATEYTKDDLLLADQVQLEVR